VCTATKKVANRNVGDFGWEIAHEAVSRRPPSPLYTIVAHTEGYTYDAKVWDLSIVQGPFSVAPCQARPSPIVTIHNFCIAVSPLTHSRRKLVSPLSLSLGGGGSAPLVATAWRCNTSCVASAASSSLVSPTNP
jgi:hypothetical protein